VSVQSPLGGSGVSLVWVLTAQWSVTLGPTLSEQSSAACVGVFGSLCLRYRWFFSITSVWRCSLSFSVVFSALLWATVQSVTLGFYLFSMDSAPVCVKFTGTNYATWAFQFEFVLKGKALRGHIDGTDVEPSSTSEKSKADGSSPSWAMLDARIMSWLLGSVESHIVTHLRPHRSAQSMWAYLKKVYYQDNDARRFQLEHAIAMFQHGSLSIQDYYSAFLTLWQEYAALVTAEVLVAALSTIQTLHATTQRDQILMKLRPEYESVRSSLLNRSPVPSLDVCFGELLREEQRLSTQTILEQSHGSSGPATVAFSAQGRGPPMHSRTLQCFCCKASGHIAANCPKKFLFLLQEEGSHYQRMSYSSPESSGPSISDFGSCHAFCRSCLSFRCVLCSCPSCTRLLHSSNGATDSNFGLISNGVSR
jgi:hypothetical protein